MARRTSSSTRPPVTEEAHTGILRQLVHQFSDPWAFYRELVQNAIDAGSSRIEVTLRYEPARRSGTTFASVRDWGEGMNRTLIESDLLTKFQSRKEQDRTRIGKFGIGFLSVFAVEPDLVQVDTGRDGEDWRIIFHRDLSYELHTAPEPLEGTCVTVVKRMGRREYESFAARSEESVRRWCRHAEVEVAFSAGDADGALPGPASSVREPFGVDAPFQVEHRDELSHVVAGPSMSEHPRCSFFNRGLTLLEVDEPLVAGVMFKADSPLLDHTLAREDVRRDRGFERVVRVVERLGRRIARRVPIELRAVAGDPARNDDYAALATWLVQRQRPQELWFPTLDREPLSSEAVGAHGNRIATTTEADETTVRLQADGWLVLRRVPGLDSAVEALVGVSPQRVEDFIWAELDPIDSFPRFRQELLRLLSKLGTDRPVTVGRLHGAASDRVAALVDPAGRPLPANRATASPFAGDLSLPLCLNRAHPHGEAALELAAQDPRLAAFLTCRLITMSHHHLTVNRDEQLIREALRA